MGSISKQQIIETLSSQAQAFYPAKQKPLVDGFVQGVFDYVAAHELAQFASDDLLGLSRTLWQLCQKRTANQSVMVFNPDVEQHEWQSKHTIIVVNIANIPFVIDSLRIAINESGHNIHRIFHAELGLTRSKAGIVQKLDGTADELLVYVEIDKCSSTEQLESIEESLLLVLDQVQKAVDDFDGVLETLAQANEAITASPVSATEKKEALAFVEWLRDHHFTFLACDYYKLTEKQIIADPQSSMGLFAGRAPRQQDLKDFGSAHQKRIKDNTLINFAKSGVKSMVHRPAWSDYIVIKHLDEKGKVIGGWRFLGLFTSAVYYGSPFTVPVVRQKLDKILSRAKFGPGSHYYKELWQILNTFPIDDLFLNTLDEIEYTASEVLNVQERKQLKLFTHIDPYGKFATVLVYAPRDIYNTRMRVQIQAALADHLPAADIDFNTWFSESVLARIRFVVRLSKPVTEAQVDLQSLQSRVQEIARQWSDDLLSSLIDSQGEEKGLYLFHQYGHAFGLSYQEKFSARVAVADILRIRQLSDECPLLINFYRSFGKDGGLKIKIYHRGELVLSDLIPVLENLGLRVMDEFPYQVDDSQDTWVYDISVTYETNPDLAVDAVRDAFADAFVASWQGMADSDPFNRLVLGASLNWQNVVMLRSFAKYMKQIQFGLSEQYIASTLLSHQQITAQLVALFEARFKPGSNASESKIKDELYGLLESVENINEDRIFRKYCNIICACQRTNFYLPATHGVYSNVSYKLRPELIGDVPKPHPTFEIFVYSPRIEGVHLRFGKVARGGLRWSDREEDFRTEILGLVKAQQVKNSVIVPVGAKGGFFAKQLPTTGGREAFMAEGVACYRSFIRGLLDITDNIIEGETCSPENVVRHDEQDPYLVVAADKGTATFSDIANSVAEDYQFWLGDAFASGGSNGYDHKKMGITARGAWVSVQRHFREQGLNVQTDPITVVGIGDMGGDVFGNGLLRSEKLKLVLAFNHLHIFVDPSPDPEKSFKERQRLFEMPRSSWEDYDNKLISKGGGIYSRSSKSIKLSSEAAKVLGISDKSVNVAPNELISAAFKAPVDLIWNGGIGTYVKASGESHADVGDKANDALRVNASDMRCKVVGEGGNLGLTQLARIEFNQHGGSCFSDFIDNAGGVDCSDHEVNMKILLNDQVSRGDLTTKQRNELLEQLTDDVAELVLESNYRQTQALSNAYSEATVRVDEHRRLIQHFEESGRLDRELEFLPSDEALLERKSRGLGLSRPELAVLIAYGKNEMKEQLIDSRLDGDKTLLEQANKTFPGTLLKRFPEAVDRHQLKVEMASTQLANDIYNHMSLAFAQRLIESTGCAAVDVAKAYIVARELFDLSRVWQQVEELDYKVSSEVQAGMMLRLSRMVRHAARWLIRNHRQEFDIRLLLDAYCEPLAMLRNELSNIVVGDVQNKWDQRQSDWVAEAVPLALAKEVAATELSYSGLSVIAVSKTVSMPVLDVAKVYFTVGERLGLDQFYSQIANLTISSHWQALARESLRDDLEAQQRQITVNVLTLAKGQKTDAETLIAAWVHGNRALVDRWFKVVREVASASEPEFTMYTVALRELVDLTQSTLHGAQTC